MELSGEFPVKTFYRIMGIPRNSSYVKYYGLTLYMDFGNNEIVSYALSSKRKDCMTYVSGLKDLIDICG